MRKNRTTTAPPWNEENQQPVLRLSNRQRRIPVDTRRIRTALRRALPMIRRSPGSDVPLEAPGEVEISILSDNSMARVHVDFLNVEGPTDVITFPYGEILLGAETAAREGAARGYCVERELTLYAIHGLLHLYGFDDKTSAAAARMRRRQDEILKASFDGL